MRLISNAKSILFLQNLMSIFFIPVVYKFFEEITFFESLLYITVFIIIFLVGYYEKELTSKSTLFFCKKCSITFKYLYKY